MANISIKGCFYYDEEKNQIVNPLFTGEYWLVDCVVYKHFKKWIKSYNKEFRDENKEDFIKRRKIFLFRSRGVLYR